MFKNIRQNFDFNKKRKPTVFTKSLLSLETLIDEQKTSQKHGHQQTIELFTIFQNKGNTNRFSNISKFASLTKKHFSSQPFATHSVRNSMNNYSKYNYLNMKCTKRPSSHKL
jgi:hypothetical protein